MSSLRGHAALLAAVALAGCGVEPATTGEDTQALIVTGHCDVSGSGANAAGDALNGSIHDSSGTPIGSWTNANGDTFVGTPDWLECRVNGSTVADFTGSGTWNGAPGYTFRVHVQDRGVAGQPIRVEQAPTTATLVATRRYSPTRTTDGTASWDAGAYATIPATLPVTVGNAGNGWATVTLAHDPGGTASLAYDVRCRYQGGARSLHPHSASDLAAGASYAFVDCQRPCSSVPSDDDDDDDHDVDEDRDHHSDEHRGGDHNHHCGGYEHGGRFYSRGDDHHGCDRDDDDGDRDGWCSDPDLIAGAQVLVASATVHIVSGDDQLPTCRNAQTVVSVDMAVQPFVWSTPENDLYRLAIWDGTGALVHSADGDIASGDITVTLLP